MVSILTFGANNFDALFATALQDITECPDFVCEPRGMKIKECLAPTILLKNPRARLLNLKARKADYGFGVGEFLWYWAGRNDLKSLEYYNKRSASFSDDGETVNSAYGFRTRTEDIFFDFGRGTNQWFACKQTLLADKDSRRALLIINLPVDNVKAAIAGSKDVPCTLSLQFFIRENRLILHSHMRSNDIVWGLTYDLFSFTLFQEAMMLELQAAGMTDLQLGEYIHTAGSLHLYEQHFNMATEISAEFNSREFHPAEPMEPLTLKGLALLAEQEEALRTGKVYQLDVNEFSGGVKWMAEQLNSHRRKRDAQRGK